MTISQGIGSGVVTIPNVDNAAANLYISNVGKTLNINAAITDNGASKLTLVKSGLGGAVSAGNLVLGSTGNSYSGDTVINQGDLNLNAANVIPDGVGKGNLVLNGSDARLTMNNNLGSPTAYSETINGLNGRGIVQNGVTTGSATVTLTVGSGNANGNFSGTLVNNTTTNTGGLLALTKTGAGTQTLSGANTYTGATTVSAGKLAVNGSTSASSAVGVSSGGTLSGSGNVGGNTTIASGGTLAPGNSPGVLTVAGTTTLSSGSIFEWEIDTAQSNPETNRGVAYDGLNTTSLSGSGAIFKIMLTGTQDFTDTLWNQSRTWTDIFKSANGSTNLADWAAVFSGGFQYAYNGKTVEPTSSGSFALAGNTLTWSAVPEPSNLLVGLLIGAGLLRRRRCA